MKTLRIVFLAMIALISVNSFAYDFFSQRILTPKGNFGYQLRPSTDYVVIGKSVEDATFEELTQRIPHYVIDTRRVYYYNSFIRETKEKVVFNYTGCDTTIDVSANYDMYPADLVSLCQDNREIYRLNNDVTTSKYCGNPLNIFNIKPIFNLSADKKTTTYQNYGSQSYELVDGNWVENRRKVDPSVIKLNDAYGILGFTGDEIRNVGQYVNVYKYKKDGTTYQYGYNELVNVDYFLKTTGYNGEVLVFDKMTIENYCDVKLYVYPNGFIRYQQGVTPVLESTISTELTIIPTAEGTEYQVPIYNNSTHRYTIKWTNANGVVFRQWDKTCMRYDVTTSTYLYDYKFYELNTITNTLELVNQYRDNTLNITNNVTDFTEYNLSNFEFYKLHMHDESSNDGNHGNYIDSMTVDIITQYYTKHLRTIKYYYYETTKSTSTSTATALTDNTSTIDISVYPNPCIDNISINGIDSEVKVDLYDLSGRVVKSEYTTKDVNVSELPRGTYIIKVSNENELLSTQKILKK